MHFRLQLPPQAAAVYIGEGPAHPGGGSSSDGIPAKLLFSSAADLKLSKISLTISEWVTKCMLLQWEVLSLFFAHPYLKTNHFLLRTLS